MKYLYAAMSVFEDGNGNTDKKGDGRMGAALLSWHAKVVMRIRHILVTWRQVLQAGGLGSITRVLTDRLAVL